MIAMETHTHICSRVAYFLCPCQCKATSDSFAQVLIEFGISDLLKLSGCMLYRFVARVSMNADKGF